MKNNIIKALNLAELKRTVRIGLSELTKIKVKDDDIVLLYDEMKVGSNIWASISEDNSKKMQLPVGEYNLANDKTVVVNPEGKIEKIIYTPTHNEELRKFIQSKSIKK